MLDWDNNGIEEETNTNNEERFRDNIHETGLDLYLNDDPEEDWGETFPEEK